MKGVSNQTIGVTMSQRATELGSQWNFEGRAMWEDSGLAHIRCSMRNTEPAFTET